MQFNRDTGKYSTKIHREAEGNTLEITLKQKDITASELNMQVKKFTDANNIDELDSNSIQLVTEELVIMVLLPKLAEGMPMQYFISHLPAQGVVKMGMGYPGEYYNPFEQEDNIFMINIFKEWISDIQFENEDNSFNELVLTMKTAQPQQEKVQKKAEPELDLESMIDREEAKQAVAVPEEASHDCFSFDGFNVGDGSVAPGAIAENYRHAETKIWEILIRDKAMDAKKWYGYLDCYLEKVDLSGSRVVFDAVVNTAESAIKSVSKVLLSDIIEHCQQRFAYVACRALHINGAGELSMRFRYPGDEYDPFVHNVDGRGIHIISRQENVLVSHHYREKVNELNICFKFLR